MKSKKSTQMSPEMLLAGLAAILGGDKASATAVSPELFSLTPSAPIARTFEVAPGNAEEKAAKPEDANGRRTDERGRKYYRVAASDKTRFALYQDVVDAIRSGQIKGLK